MPQINIFAAASEMPSGYKGSDGKRYITLSEDVALSSRWVVSENVVLDLNGHAISRNLSSSAYNGEWASNVSIGASGESEGFADATRQTMDFLAEYINKYNIDTNNTKFWVTGYSRTGAVSNMVAKRLIDTYNNDGTKVFAYCNALANGSLAVESYIGKIISIVKKASDTNHADSTAQTITVPQRPTAPTGISSTKASGIDASDGTIANVNDTMEYKAADADTWQSVTGTQITGLAAGSYEVRYKATSTEFASTSAAVTISVVGTYTITFVNYDNSELQILYVTEGAMPQYTGETPTKPSDDMYSYTFAGWSPEIAEVSGIAVYTAQFERTPIDYYVELTDEVKAVVLAPEAGTYELIFAAYDSSGALKSVELQNITFDEAGEQEFEPETLDMNGAVKIKVMLWSDISEMTPKCGSDEMSLQ